jgi:predicted naringenin-chalcone synthase
MSGRNTGIQNRYFHHDEQMLRDHPEFLDDRLPSIDVRQEILAAAVPELAAAAAAKAIAEWGRPAADITHLVVSTYSGAHVPGVDLRVASLLGLRPNVQRTMLYLKACSAGSAALRLTKDMAENNRGARVLVVCADLSLIFFRGPDKARLDTVVAHTLFGDGAGAIIVGADPDITTESPIFEMVSSSQATVPGTQHVVSGHIGKAGLHYSLSSELPFLVASNIEQCLLDVFQPLGHVISGGWNSMFMAVHPGGRAILDSVEAALELEPEKLAASRRVLRDYGNMAGVSVIFVLDEIRRRSHGEEWGVLVGFGPGITVETMVLRACNRKH